MAEKACKRLREYDAVGQYRVSHNREQFRQKFFSNSEQLLGPEIILVRGSVKLGNRTNFLSLKYLLQALRRFLSFSRYGCSSSPLTSYLLIASSKGLISTHAALTKSIPDPASDLSQLRMSSNLASYRLTFLMNSAFERIGRSPGVEIPCDIRLPAGPNRLPLKFSVCRNMSLLNIRLISTLRMNSTLVASFSHADPPHRVRLILLNILSRTVVAVHTIELSSLERLFPQLAHTLPLTLYPSPLRSLPFLSGASPLSLSEIFCSLPHVVIRATRCLGHKKKLNVCDE